MAVTGVSQYRTTLILTTQEVPQMPGRRPPHTNHPAHVKLPYAAYRSYVIRRMGWLATVPEMADWLDLDPERLRRFETAEVMTIRTAAGLAEMLRVHPTEIWADAWWAATELDAPSPATTTHSDTLPRSVKESA